MNAEQLKDSLKVNAAIFTLMEINDKYTENRSNWLHKGVKVALNRLREQLLAVIVLAVAL